MPETPGTHADTGIMALHQAKAIALAHAGVTEEQISGLKEEYDEDDGVKSYEIEFIHDGVEYEYDIHAVSGDIIKSEKDGADNRTPVDGQLLTEEQAKTIAFNHAGVAAGSVYDLEVELDRDDGTEHYEISFECGGVEYEYEIHAYSGKILKAEKDHD